MDCCLVLVAFLFPFVPLSPPRNAALAVLLYTPAQRALVHVPAFSSPRLSFARRRLGSRVSKRLLDCYRVGDGGVVLCDVKQ